MLLNWSLVFELRTSIERRENALENVSSSHYRDLGDCRTSTHTHISLLCYLPTHYRQMNWAVGIRKEKNERDEIFNSELFTPIVRMEFMASNRLCTRNQSLKKLFPEKSSIFRLSLEIIRLIQPSLSLPPIHSVSQFLFRTSSSSWT